MNRLTKLCDGRLTLSLSQLSTAGEPVLIQGTEKIKCIMVEEPPQTADEIILRYSKGQRRFTNVDLDDGADFIGANLEDTIFDSCFLSDANFRNARLRGVIFRNCNIKCCDFRGADLRNTNFYGSAVEAIFLEGANLVDASFEGAWSYGYEFRTEERPPN